MMAASHRPGPTALQCLVLLSLLCLTAAQVSYLQLASAHAPSTITTGYPHQRWRQAAGGMGSYTCPASCPAPSATLLIHYSSPMNYLPPILQSPLPSCRRSRSCRPKSRHSGSSWRPMGSSLGWCLSWPPRCTGWNSWRPMAGRGSPRQRAYTSAQGARLATKLHGRFSGCALAATGPLSLSALQRLVLGGRAANART